MARKNFKRGGGSKQKAKPEEREQIAEPEKTPEVKSAAGAQKGDFKGKKRLRFNKKGGIVKKSAGEPATDFAGLIFMCNTETKQDCFKYHVFGLPEAKKDVVERAKKGIKLFLFDIDQKVLYGVYRASSLGGMNLVSEAFQSSERKFPAQIRFRIHKDCAPLDESVFKPVIKDNYFGRNKFRLELSSEQVGKLLQLFRPLDARGLPKPKAGKDVKGEPSQKGIVRGKPLHQKGSAPRAPRTGAPLGSNRSGRMREPATGYHARSLTREPLPTNSFVHSQPSKYPGLVSDLDISRLDADVLYRQRLDALDRRAYPVTDVSLRHVGLPSEYVRGGRLDELYETPRIVLPPLKGTLPYDDLYREMPYQRDVLYGGRDEGRTALSYKPLATLPWGY